MNSIGWISFISKVQEFCLERSIYWLLTSNLFNGKLYFYSSTVWKLGVNYDWIADFDIN